MTWVWISAAALLLAFWAPWPAFIAWLVWTTWGVISLRSGIHGRALCRIEGTPDGVALTYDDGPDPSVTPRLLDLLGQRGALATFFIVGCRALEHPDLVRRIAEEGHTLGNHSHRHSVFNNLLHVPYLRRDMERCQQSIEAATGIRPQFYRPPMGLSNPIVAPVARSLGMRVTGWSIRSFDTWGEPAPVVIARVLNRVHPGAIVLLHDRGENTVEITRGILDGLEQRGLKTRLLPTRSSTVRGPDTSVVTIPKDAPWFEGHFPGSPVLPGVVQIGLVHRAAEKRAGRSLRLAAIGRLRLRQTVRPGDVLRIDLHGESPTRFVIRSDGTKVADGEIDFS